MIAMMQALNTQYFGGRPRVTCFTCHRGSILRSVPPVSRSSTASLRKTLTSSIFRPKPGVSADQVLDRYLTALGGTAALAKITERHGHRHLHGIRHRPGGSAGGDIRQSTEPADWIVKLPQGDSYRVFDGVNGWIAVPTARRRSSRS